LVPVSDLGHTADGTACLVMEYLHEQSLGRRIRDLAERGERLPIATALHVGVQVADELGVDRCREATEGAVRELASR